MIRANSGSYRVFNVKTGTDKNNKKYIKFSISDSKKKPNSDEWVNTWWNVTTYSNVELKAQDYIVITKISGAEMDMWNGEARGSMFASIELAERKESKPKEEKSTFAKGEDMRGHQTAFEVDDEMLPF